jgi:hypothetical protein
MRERTVFKPGTWCWLLPVLYAGHIAEEFYAGAGFHTWVGSLVPFSPASFLGVNVIIISLIAGAVGLGLSGGRLSLLLVAVAVQFMVHGLLIHPISSLWAGAASPGLLSGLLVLVPVASGLFLWARGALSRGPFWGGVGIGILLLSSQDLWRVLFNAVLPAA